MASSRQRPRMLPHVFQCTAQPPQQRLAQLRTSVVLRWVSPAISHAIVMHVGSSITQKLLSAPPHHVIRVNKWTLPYQSTYLVGNTSLC